MRFVRVPPYEKWAFWTNFYFSCEDGDFFLGQTCCTLFYTKNEEKSQKISTCIRLHTRVYANTSLIGLNSCKINTCLTMMRECGRASNQQRSSLDLQTTCYAKSSLPPSLKYYLKCFFIIVFEREGCANKWWQRRNISLQDRDAKTCVVCFWWFHGEKNCRSCRYLPPSLDCESGIVRSGVSLA